MNLNQSLGVPAFKDSKREEQQLVARRTSSSLDAELSLWKGNRETELRLRGSSPVSFSFEASRYVLWASHPFVKNGGGGSFSPL